MFPAHEGASFVGRKGAVLSWRKRFPPFLSPVFLINYFFFWTLATVASKEAVWSELMVRSVAPVCLWQFSGTFALFVQGGQCRSTVNRWVRGLCSPLPNLQKLSPWGIAPSSSSQPLHMTHILHWSWLQIQIILRKMSCGPLAVAQWAVTLCRCRAVCLWFLFFVPSQRSVLGAARPCVLLM